MIIGQQVTIGAGASVIPTPPAPKPFKVFNNDDIDTSFDTFAEARAYIDAFAWTSDINLEMTSDDVIVLPTTWDVNYDNNGYEFNIFGSTGFRPRLSGGGTLETILDVTQTGCNVTNVDFIDCDKTIGSGCNIRLRSPCNSFTIDQSVIADGYSGIRGTGSQTTDGIAITTLNGITCRNITFRRMANGAARLGNGVISDPNEYNTNWSIRPDEWYDMHDVVFENITLEDVDNMGASGGFATNLVLLLKKIKNLTVTNVTCNGTYEGVLAIQSSYNVVVNRVYGENIAFNGLTNQSCLICSGVDKLYIKNTFLKPRADGVGKRIIYCSDSREIYLYFNTCIAVNSGDSPCATQHCKTHNLFGNLLMHLSTQALNIYITNKHGNVGNISDIVRDDYNVYVSGGTFNVNASIKSADNLVNVELRNNTGGGRYNIATYYSTFGLGQNSLIPTGNVVTYVNNLLTSGSTGYKRVVGASAVEALDLFGVTRADPCNTGATD